MALLDIGREYVINQAGVIFKEREAADKTSLPRVTGLEYSDIITNSCRPSDSMDGFLDLIKVLQRGEKAMSLQTVSRIHVDRDIGLTLYSHGPIKTVKFGFNNFDKKYQRLRMLMKYLKQQKNIHTVTSVDLVNENYIVATPVWEDNTPDKTIRRS